MKINNQSPSQMEPDAIVKEIQALRADMQKGTERMFELSRVLYSKVRRDTRPDTAALILYANAWTRFSGAMGQGLRRTASTDRVLRAARLQEQERQEQEERQRLLEERRREQAEAAATHIYGSDLDMEDDLVALYGQEVTHASV